MQNPQDVIDRLNATLAERYTVQRRVGQGGMATVFLARDLRHDREVAIKVLDRDLGSHSSSERFLREVQVAARLSHPHILPLHDSGVGDGLLFYVMPYVAGDSLRGRLRRERQLPMDDVVRITREVGEALTYAHEQGVLHRDIKPENILLSGSSALVADFGIAKALSLAADESITTTAPGIAVGTPQYMSPEQAFGDPNLSGRSDVYSLACVAYEMIAGEPPFTGTSAQALLARHSSDPMPSLRTLRGTVSLEVEEVIRKGLAKSPADRYGTPAEFAGALASAVSRPGTTVPIPVLPRRAARVWRFAAMGAAAVAVAAGTLLLSRNLPSGAERVPMMVVLPFTYDGAPEQRYFADGLTDEITSRLARLPALGVISRSGAATYVRGGKSLREIAEELGVEYVLEGTVRAEPAATGLGSLRVIPSLTHVADNRVIWSEAQTVRLVPGSLFAVQGEIAENVATSLNVRLAPGDRAALRAEPTQNAEAYQAYLRGVALAGIRYPAAPVLQSIQHLRQAVALDPRFAQAWARLGVAHTSFYSTFERTAARRDSARAAVAQARALAPDLPETRVAEALFQLYTQPPDSASLAGVVGVLAAQPNDAELLWLTGSAYRRLGRWDDAIASYRRALRLNPRSAAYALDLGMTHMVMRDFSEAGRLVARAREAAPDLGLTWIYSVMLAYVATGNLDSGRAVFDTAAQRLGYIPFLSQMVRFPYTLAVLGDDVLDSLPRVSLAAIPFDSVRYYLAVGWWHASRGRAAAATAAYDSAHRVAVRLVRVQPDDPSLRAEHAVALAGAGRTAEAAAAADSAWDQLARYNDAFLAPAFRLYVLQADIMAGRHEVALDRLDQLLRVPGPVSAAFMRTDPVLEPLRRLPRFQQLLRTHGAAR